MEKVELPFCSCGCGNTVRRSTSKYLQGHYARVNNPSTLQHVKEKRREQFKKFHEDGTFGDPWNKGLTKHTDNRVESYGKKRSKAFTDEDKLRASKLMKRLWKDGKIVPLTGENHPAWQGGTSTISCRCRGSNKLYTFWKKPILERDKFLCQKCFRGSMEVRLAVHHDKEMFKDIVLKFMPTHMRKLSFEEQTEIVAKIEQYHVDNKVSGVTICYDCHDEVHKYTVDEDV